MCGESMDAHVSIAWRTPARNAGGQEESTPPEPSRDPIAGERKGAAGDGFSGQGRAQSANAPTSRSLHRRCCTRPCYPGVVCIAHPRIDLWVRAARVVRGQGAPRRARSDKAANAVGNLGPTLVGAAATTIGALFPMFFTEARLLQLLGGMVSIAILASFSLSILLFLPAYVLCGPAPLANRAPEVVSGWWHIARSTPRSVMVNIRM